MNETNSKQQQQQQQQASVSASAAAAQADSGSASPGAYSAAPSHMTDSMSRYGQAAAAADPLGRNGPPPWPNYVYQVEPGVRGLAPFAGQPYRPSYQAFPASGQYSEPFEQYLGGPLPPDYPVRYPADKGDNNGAMGYAAPSALPPFSTLNPHQQAPPGRGHTPGLKDELGEFPRGEFGDALGSRLERSLSREDAYNSSSSLVQYRPWEIGGRGEAPSAHASPTSPSSSYSFAEGFLKFQPGSLMADKGGPSNGGGASPGPDDKAWYHKGGAASPYSKDSSALPHPDKHKDDKAGGANGNTLSSGASSNNNNNNSEPNRPPAPSSVGYSGDGSSGAEDAKGGANLYPQYDQRDMLLSFGSPHQTAAYDYYPPNPAGGGAWAGYGDAAKAGGYHPRPYSQNGRADYGNGNAAPERTYQLSPHDKLAAQHTPSPPGGGGGAAYKKGRGRGRGGAVGQVAAVSSSGPAKGHDEYGPTAAKQAALSSGADDSSAPADKPKKKKRKRCGECYGCQRKDNCGECAPCRNEKSHQICKMRRCEKLIEKKGNNNSAAAPATPPATHVQPPPPPPPTVADKIQYLGAGANAGTAWW